MKIAATSLVYLVAVMHIGFMILESFLWTKPIGLKIFAMRPEAAEATKVLAMNQGVYNGFLAAGLIWGACAQDYKITMFFLVCVMIAGLVGGLTASKSIIFVQFLPAMAALILVYLNKYA